MSYNNNIVIAIISYGVAVRYFKYIIYNPLGNFTR